MKITPLCLLFSILSYSALAGGNDKVNALVIPCQASAAAASTNTVAASTVCVLETLIPQKPGTMRIAVAAAGIDAATTGTVTFVFVPCRADGTGADDPASSLFRVSVPVKGTDLSQNGDIFSVVGVQALKHAWTINGAGGITTNLAAAVYWP